MSMLLIEPRAASSMGAAMAECQFGQGQRDCKALACMDFPCDALLESALDGDDSSQEWWHEAFVELKI